MGEHLIGVAAYAPDAATTLSQIRRTEEMGIRGVWLTSGGRGGDAPTALAAVAAQTDQIMLGTSIVQTWSRHPVTVAQQAQVIANLAPRRFRLGVGPSHKQSMEHTYGADFHAPLGHLREYLQILKGLLQQGMVDFDGRFYTAHARLSEATEVPVMASALRSKAFELCGAEADGAISWVCPHQYLRDMALPALRSGAEQAGRHTPSLIVHAPVCVDESLSAVRQAVRRQLGQFPRSPFYARMFSAAGFPTAADTGWTDEMLDSVVVSGDETSVAAQIEEIFKLGASEVLATVISVDDRPGQSADRTMKLLAELSA